ncbi:MAG: hypothetical protein FH762_09505 [Firmicutes bacterium]|nr:hypothetical protein [Bacillota bacterium]
MKINVRLRPEKDDKLKAWYCSLPEGDRSRVIRNILKEYAETGQTPEVLDYRPKQARKVINKTIDLENIEFKETESNKEITEKEIDSKVDDLLNNF